MKLLFWLSSALAISTGLSLALTPLVAHGAGALRLFDSPDGGRRLHAAPVPRVGGVAVFVVASIVASLLFVRAGHTFLAGGPEGQAQLAMLTGMLIGSALLFVVGLTDDLRGLSPGVKSVAQVLAAAIVYFFGFRIEAIALGYGAGVPVGILEVPLIFLWIVGVTNAYNFIDGLNGLAAGVAAIACATIVAVGLTLGNYFLLIPAVVLGGAVLGFLPYNFPKGRIFLGDSGSLSIGFLLACLSIQASVNRHGAVLAIIPLLAVTVPLLDVALAIARRFLRKVPLSGADARHIHHRLLALGVSPKRATIVLWLLSAGMAGFGLVIALTAPFVAASVATLGWIGVALLVIYGTNLLSYHELRVAGEVLLSAPSRARRVISDQIIALDLTARVQNAQSVSQVSGILSDAAGDFGFLGMELTGDHVVPDVLAGRVMPAHWAWKLVYPIRSTADNRAIAYSLSIWCSPEQSARPYGAERIARILGPALQAWFETRDDEGEETTAPRAPPARRRLRIH